MSDSTNHFRLIDETLAHSRLNRSGCFFSNAAGADLARCDVSALSEIENVLLTKIVPNSRSATDHNDLLKEHIGLTDLWIAYYKIARQWDLSRIRPFLQSLDGPILAVAILELAPVWNNRGPGVTLPPDLLDFMKEVAARPAGNAAEIARHQLRRVWLPGEKPPVPSS